MFAYRAQFLRRIGRSVSYARPQALARPYHPSYQSLANQSTGQGQNEAQHQKIPFRGKLKVYLFLSTMVGLVIRFGYEPLRDYGLFDNITSSTIFRVVPPKRVKPASTVDAALYQPITRDKEIRLLVLEPGASGEELKCHLVNVQLSWRTKYEALSYTWGDPAITRRLSCSGRTINVTINLYDALTDLRNRKHKRLLWVDAVCINQADNDEKAKQIRLMGDIYSQARRVLIYLGKADPSVDGAMRSIRSLDQKFAPLYIRRYSTRLRVLGDVGNELIDRLPKMKPIPEDQVSWDQIINLLRRPWFQRTWIIQEAVLAKRAQVICGDQSISWVMLERVVVAMNAYKSTVCEIPGYRLIDDAVACIYLMRAARRERYAYIFRPEDWLLHRLSGPLFQRQEHSKLLDLILDSRMFACTDPRDKVFGMLGVTSQDTGSEYLTPNYALSPEDVFRNFVLWDIFHNSSLRVLGSSSDKAGRQHSSPSWVPDFTRLDPYYRSLTRTENRASFHASGDSSIHARTSNSDNVLHVKGRIVDRLYTVAEKSISDPYAFFDADGRMNEQTTWYDQLQRDADMIKEAMIIWLAAVKRLNKGLCPDSTAHRMLTIKPIDGRVGFDDDVPPLWAAFLRTLICNRTNHGQEATDIFVPMVATYVRLTLAGPLLPGSFIRRNMPLAENARQAVSLAAQSRRFAATDMGLTGYVPMRAKKGDLVVILYGANVPFIVRRETGGRYSLVGECYMHGIMYGQALRIVEIKNEDTEFAIV